MESRAGDREWSGSMTGSNAKAGALVWVLRRNGCWWPGQILGTDELPKNYVIPPRSFGTPIKLLGRPDGSIDWYNIEKSEHVKPFRCREFDMCIENAKVQRRLQREACNKGKYVSINDAIMHALEIEMSRFPNEEPTNQTTEYSKEDISPIQDGRKNKMEIIRFVTPISKENHKRDNSSMPLLDEGAMKCQVLESDAVGLDARVEGSVFKPTELKNNIKVCDVEMEAYGNYKGHGLPLTFLISKSTGKPIKGYPVAVEVLEDSCPVPTTKVNGSAISCFDYLMESGISVPRQARSLRKPSGSRKISEHDLGKSWGPDARSFSSYSNSPRKNLTERSNRKAVVAEGFPPPTQSTSKPASSPRHMQSLSYFSDSRGECANSGPLVVKGSPWPSLSLRVDAMEDSESNADEFHSDSSDNEYQSDSSTDEYHSGSSADEDYVRPITYIAGSQGSPPFLSPVATSSRSINGCALYLCSASTLCAPVRLV